MSKLFLCDKKHLINNTRKRFFWLLLVPVFFVAFPSSGITNNAPSSYIGSNSYAYSYDGIGNRTGATENNAVTTYTCNLVNQYTAVNAVVPVYDLDGNMTNYNGWAYTYNGENRLIVAENAADGVRVEADYDYMGRRLFKKVYNNNTLTKHSVFVYDGFKQIAEFDVLNNNSLKASYLWQPVGLDVVLLRNNEYLVADGNKNIIQVRNATGNVTDSYVYDPFGKVTHNGSSENPFRFSSEFFDDETELVYYNYRYYNPNLGRWINRDPIEEEGGWNLYVMVNNDSILLADEKGLEKRKEWKNDEEKKNALCQAILNSDFDLNKFIDKYDPTFEGENAYALFNLEYRTPFGDTDIDWMLTLLAANKGRGPWYLKGSSPHVLYAIGKTYWIVKDAIDDPNVDIDFSRYGQENEKNAIKAATALLKGEISLRSLYESLKCKDLCLKKKHRIK